MNFCIFKYDKDCKSACSQNFKHKKQEYVYFLSLTNKKHVPVNMCFRFPKLEKTWKYRSNSFGVINQALEAFPSCFEL